MMSGQLSGWRTNTAAAIGGAGQGELVLNVGLMPGGSVLASAVGAAANSFARQGLRFASGKHCGFNFSRIRDDVAAGAISGLMPGRLHPGINSGRNSYLAIYKQMVTKFQNRTISTVSWSTAAKMFLGVSTETAFFEGTIVGAEASAAIGD